MNIEISVAPVALSSGTSLASMRISLTDLRGNPVTNTDGVYMQPVTIAAVGGTATFADAVPGNWMACAQPLDVQGNDVESAIMQAFAVARTPDTSLVVTLGTPDAPEQPASDAPLVITATN